MTRPRTLFEKIWDDHVIQALEDGNCLLYVDRILLHEISSPQAFEALRAVGAKLRRPETVLGVADHDVPTLNRSAGIKDERTRHQVEVMARNCTDFGVQFFATDDPRHGITHVIGPEQGMILPGAVVVCCDSHATTYGAFGALGFGIGASEIETVLRTNSILQSPARTLRITLNGQPRPGVVAKDLILAVIGAIGTAAGTGSIIEFDGDAVRAMSMEGRMTICNMAIEAGARSGLVAPDDVTFAYLEDRPMAPTGRDWEQALAYWRTLGSDDGATFDNEVALDAAQVAPQVTWGTSPEEVLPITGCVPDPAAEANAERREAMQRALAYMDLTPGQAINGLAIDRVFIGSCTNARIEDLIAAARVLKGRTVASGIDAMVVPGSALIKSQAEEMRLDRVFISAGFSWRDAGCSMCGVQSGDYLRPYERCASTSNRNFENRQGRLGRTHLMSPAMAAAAAVAGCLTDVREMI